MPGVEIDLEDVQTVLDAHGIIRAIEFGEEHYNSESKRVFALLTDADKTRIGAVTGDVETMAEAARANLEEVLYEKGVLDRYKNPWMFFNDENKGNRLVNSQMIGEPMLTQEQKKIIIDYVFEPDAFFKGMMEDTSLGETYGEPDGVTEKEFGEFIMEMKKREETYLGLTQRKLLLNFREPIFFQMSDDRSAHVQSMKIIENGAGDGKHIVYAVLPLLGDMTPVEPPVEASVWLGVNMRMIQELQE